MNQGRTVFSQLLEFLPRHEFDKCVVCYRGNHRVRHFSCYSQFLCLAFAQLTFRESLRDIEICLRALGAKTYHSGIRGTVSRSTMADANETRDWRIFADFAKILIAQARRLYQDEDFGVDLANTVYALDSTTIDLCLSLFPWAEFRRRKGAVKLHTLLDLRGNLPTDIIVTTGKCHDVRVLDDITFEPGAIYIMDRGYLDFKRLNRIHRSGAFFVTRLKSNTQLRRLYSSRVDKSTGVRSDQTVVLKLEKARADFQDQLRRVHFVDPETGKRLLFLTNNFEFPAQVIALLYRRRWQVELFFKWIKQHLRIKAFFGTSENAVKTQIWVAVSIYVLVAIVKKRLQLDHSLYTILQFFSLSLFEKIQIPQALSQIDSEPEDPSSPKQLILFES